ncbi:MAG: arsenate reductase family protein [Brevirhabdus sp.]
MKLYGLKTCDTCRKAAKALEAAGKDVDIVDIRQDPLDGRTRARFLAAFGDALVNRRSTTWRGLSQSERDADAEALLAMHPTLMKRPVIEDGQVLTLGWDKAAQAAHLGG